MQQTSNYNLNLPEGTDVVNPLVDYNPNFSTIDSAMKANADRTVGRATCIKSGTTHVVTRSNTGSNIINFTATGDWNTGDTMTIDSTIVSVFLPDGSAALDGAYVINTEVFGILNGTRFTLYSNQSLNTDYAEKTDIAAKETGATASRAYSVGELVYVSGVLYEVKAAISSGAAFNVGVNIEACDVSKVLHDLTAQIAKKNVAGANLLTFTNGIRDFNMSLFTGRSVKTLISVYANMDVPLHYFPIDTSANNFTVRIVLEGGYASYGGDVPISFIFDEV